MNRLPSKLDFVSLLKYSPHGTTNISAASRQITYAIKGDRYYGKVRAIPQAAMRIKEQLSDHSFLYECFGPDVTLIPMPRSSPLKPGTLWPSMRICEAVQNEGLCESIFPCLTRVSSVTKAATAKVGGRPEPDDHFQSTLVEFEPLLSMPKRITIVDDVITRGSSMIGIYPRIQEAFPEAQIRCFALVRTMSGQEVDVVIEPILGTIQFQGNTLRRHP